MQEKQLLHNSPVSKNYFCAHSPFLSVIPSGPEFPTSLHLTAATYATLRKERRMHSTGTRLLTGNSGK